MRAVGANPYLTVSAPVPAGTLAVRLYFAEPAEDHEVRILVEGVPRGTPPVLDVPFVPKIVELGSIPVDHVLDLRLERVGAGPGPRVAGVELVPAAP